MPQRFSFPLDEATRYAGRVTFQAFETIPPEIKIIRRRPVETNGTEELADEAKLDEVKRSEQSGGRVLLDTKPKFRHLDKCSLFLPQGITFQDGVAFDEFALGRVGGTTEAALLNGESLARATSAGLQQNVSALTDIFNGLPTGDVARLAAARASKFAGDQVASAVQSVGRVTTNPNKKVLFREVNIREFSFTFKLIPTSRAEAEMIKRIIKFFRTELYPEDSIRVDTSAGVSIPIGYKFPNQFTITFSHRDQKIAHRLLPAYLVGMQTVYNPSGMGFFEDGNFSEVEVTMNFRESRALSKREIRDGGY